MKSAFTFAAIFQAFCFTYYAIATTTTIKVAATSLFTNETDREALLAIKNQVLGDPLGVFNSWNSSVHFCDWQGVECGHRHQRVTALNLTSLKLSGSLPTHVGNLTFLRVIDLSNNSFHGEIPQEIGRLFRLQNLYLLNNSFQGELPSNLSHCSDLRIMFLFGNKLAGKIPQEISSLAKLKQLALSANSFTGTIPSSLGNLSALALLSLRANHLEGSIPVELGQLSGLRFLQLSSNNLSGMVPKQLFNISSMQIFSMANNKLRGHLPHDLGLTISHIQTVFLGLNQFSGPIPTSIVNASSLVQISLDSNKLTGPIPKNLGMLQNLEYINFAGNPLEDESELSFLTSLTNCTNLRELWFCQNNLRGSLPDSISNLSINLNTFAMCGNHLYGSIPQGMGNLVNLVFLVLADNALTDGIPNSIGMLSKLSRLDLYINKISGKIPSSFGNLTQLVSLSLDNNLLEGSIPVSLGNCTHLEILQLSYNHLNGNIPEQVFGLSTLLFLLLNSNNLTGPLPSQVGNLKNLNILDVSENKLSGKIPSTLESCQVVESLNMSSNIFEGTIPSTFRNLKGITFLNLSHNNLSGQIPEFLGKLPLTTLNLSFNDFEGKVPTLGIFRDIKAFSVLGNNKLCGGIEPLQLPGCQSKKKGSHFSRKMIIVVVASVVLFIIVLVACLYAATRVRASKRKPSSSSPLLKEHPKLSYADLVHATDGFSSANLIGEGRYGSVYRGNLGNDEQIVAVKVFNLQERGAYKSFMAECEALRSVKHRNLVKIITSCSSIDFKGNDFKALVFEFLPNGSLESWLHPNSIELENLKNLKLVQRFNIAVDVASALDYLHNQCDTPIVHCDLKPSNILLNNDLTAHVGDFGLTKFLPATAGISNDAQSSSIGARGTVGYVAPEYGMFEGVSTLGDVYSYGILLMELFTGRRPTDSLFLDNLSLHNFVKVALHDRVTEIVDPFLAFGENGQSTLTSQGNRDNNGKIQEFLASILHLGVLCSADSPRERPEIKDVLKELYALRGMVEREIERERVLTNN